MHRINRLLSLSSLAVVLVSIERFSVTGRIFLPPFNFLHLHEVLQMTTLILFTVIIPFFLLREVTSNFKALSTKTGFVLVLLFIIGIYFYSTGNGVHEQASFTFNTYCKSISGNFCGGQFFSDYYYGNILYFIGAFLLNLPLILFESKNPSKDFAKKDLALLIVNCVIYSLAILAYSGFDRVLVGLVYSLIMMTIALFVFWPHRRECVHYPVTFFLVITYSLGSLTSLLVRLTHVG